MDMIGKKLTMKDLEAINFPYYYNLIVEGKMKAKEVKDLLFNGNGNRYGRYVRFLGGKTPEQIKAEWKDKLKAMNEEESNQFFIKHMIRITERDKVLIKRCYKCMEYKMVERGFSKCKNQKDGLQNKCNKCAGKRAKEQREANPDYWKERYENNKEAILNQQKERYEAKILQALEDIRLIVEANPTKYDYIPGMKIYGIIYLVYNRITKRYYVGQTIQGFDLRYSDGFFHNHIDKRIEDERYNGPNELLQQDLELYGEDSFKFNKIFKVASNKYELDKLEAYWIDHFNSYEAGYNRNRGMIFTNRGLEE